MADINECYQLLKYRATKSGYNGNISPNDFNLIWPRAERRHFNNQYKQYILSQEIGDSLLPYKTDPIPIIVNDQGIYTKPQPTDILHIDSIRSPYGTVESEVARFYDDRLANKLSSLYDAPSAEFPIFIEYKNYLKFYPVNIGNAILVYLEKLTDSKWAYTLDSNDRPVYDEAASIQPKWGDDDIDEISYIVLSDLGINMRDGMLQSFAETKIKTNL